MPSTPATIPAAFVTIFRMLFSSSQSLRWKAFGPESSPHKGGGGAASRTSKRPESVHPGLGEGQPAGGVGGGVVTDRPVDQAEAHVGPVQPQYGGIERVVEQVVEP